MISDESELISVAEDILQNGSFSKIFCLSGELGAGKTRLIKSFCLVLKVHDDVSSPTYSLVNEYKSDLGPIYHMDLYRLENLEEVQDIGLVEYLTGDRPVFIEWPQIANLILPPANQINIEVLDDSARKIVHLYNSST